MTAAPRTPLGEASLASDWSVDVLQGSDWTPVNGISGFNPATPVTLDEVQTLNTDGWTVQVKSGMAWSLVINVLRKPTKDQQPVYDAGQEALRDAADDPWGAVTVRWYKMDAVRTEAYTGTGVVEYVPQGGNVGDADAAQITITGQGARTRINHPAPV